jgi:hypothetical protein
MSVECHKYSFGEQADLKACAAIELLVHNYKDAFAHIAAHLVAVTLGGPDDHGDASCHRHPSRPQRSARHSAGFFRSDYLDLH